MDIDVFSMSDLLQGLGFQFWVSLIEEQKITNVDCCLKMIKYLQKYLNDLMPNQQHDLDHNTNFTSIDDALDLYSLTDLDEIKAVLMMLGFKFWNKTILAQNIIELNHCKEIIKYLRECFIINNNRGAKI